MRKTLFIEYEEFQHWGELDPMDQELVKKSIEISDAAYAPYSKFKVGATLRLKSGRIVSGSNQENIAYPSGLCAERVALFYAGSNYPNDEVETICVIAKGNLVPVEQLLSPCGGCRQVMLETQNRQERNIRVILVSQNGVTLLFNRVEDLLPLSFGKK